MFSFAKMIVLFLIIMIICEVSNGEVYKVGDSSGWTNMGNLNYKSWAAAKEFHVGDTIVFEYNKQFHNVVRVTHKNFNACNSTASYATWSSGNDSFTITRPGGHYYYICGIPGHCQSGQKVDIRVVSVAHTPAPTPSPIASGPSPQISPAESPLNHKNGCSSIYSSVKIWALVLSLMGLKAIAAF